MLTATNISKHYQTQQVLADINIEVGRGELVCLLGESGVGKTTLFQILSGLERPDEGAVFLQGEEITGISGKMSYMQQKDLLLPFETILDNVAIPLTLRGAPKKAARETARPYFAEFGLVGCEHKYPAQLSGGMRQRAALLRACLFSDQLMLLDEPFSALDVTTKAAIQMWFIAVMKNRQTTALFITHDVDEAILLSDRIYILSGAPGRISHEATLCGTYKADPDFAVSAHFLAYKKEILRHL